MEKSTFLNSGNLLDVLRSELNIIYLYNFKFINSLVLITIIKKWLKYIIKLD